MRPILWRALRYLHDADQGAYRDQLSILWAKPDLRLHIRLLIIEFLGQAKEPLDFEIEMIRPALRDPDLREPIVRSIQGNPSWFAQVLGDLPTMMVADNVSAHLAVRLLRPALSFGADAVLSLIERCWLPDMTRDALTILTLGELKAWDDHAIQIAEIVYRRNPPHASFSRHLEHVVAQSRPDLASRLVAAELSHNLELAEAESQSTPVPPPEDASEVDQNVFLLSEGNARREAVKELVRHETRWYGISKLAQAAPGSFMEHVWPLVLRVANLFADRRTLRKISYFEDHTFNNSYRYHEDLTSGIDRAIAGFAEEQPYEFIQFARENHSSDLLSIHRWFTMGYCRLGRMKPAECIEYLLGDSRRFALGPSQNQHQETCQLIQASTPFAEPAAVRALEREICRWVYYPSAPDDDAKSRFDRMKWSRERRLRVLRSIPADVISKEAAKLLQEEERALPETPNSDWGLTEFDTIGSAIGPEKMALASREDLMRLFDELHDGTGWEHPHDWMKGGVVQASRAFGQLAKEDADLAISIIHDLSPTRHEQYASEAIRNLAESALCHPSELIKIIHLLSSRGFASEVFRHGAASAFSKVAEKLDGLPDDSCEMLESWLNEWKDKPREQLEDGSNSDWGPKNNVRSILWDDRGRILPWGNYPVLEALFLGYLLRKPRDTKSWLGVLERHAQRDENPQVWKALANHQMRFFGQADHQRAATLLKNVLECTEVLHSEEVARLVARLHAWLPASLTHSCLSQWQTGTWPEGPQAAAEVAMLRHALVPTDEYCSDFVSRILAGTAGNGEQLARMKLGITYASAEVWNVPKARAEATRVLTSVLPCTDEDTVYAWRRVFNSPWEIVDDCSRQILDALLANREILRTPHIDPLVDRLKELIGRSLEPQRVCLVVSAVVDECGSEIGNFSTAWPALANDLIHIALTLQRLSSTADCGVQIFERLMASNAYRIDEVLNDLDRKWPS